MGIPAGGQRKCYTLASIGLLWVTNRRTGNQGAPKHSLLGEWNRIICPAFPKLGQQITHTLIGISSLCTWTITIWRNWLYHLQWLTDGASWYGFILPFWDFALSMAIQAWWLRWWSSSDYALQSIWCLQGGSKYKQPSAQLVLKEIIPKSGFGEGATHIRAG